MNKLLLFSTGLVVGVLAPPISVIFVPPVKRGFSKIASKAAIRLMEKDEKFRNLTLRASKKTIELYDEEVSILHSGGRTTLTCFINN